MSEKNIFAYTAPGADYPEFVSVNASPSGIEFVIRSRREIGGATAQVLLDYPEAQRLYYALQMQLFDDGEGEPT